METRMVVEEDYFTVIDVLDDWWGGWQMTHLLPRLFFEHFQATSFIMEENRSLAAFLIGFVSQTCSDEAYIHFVGVSPNMRNNGLARQLYERFFVTVRNVGCHSCFPETFRLILERIEIEVLFVRYDVHDECSSILTDSLFPEILARIRM